MFGPISLAGVIALKLGLFAKCAVAKIWALKVVGLVVMVIVLVLKATFLSTIIGFGTLGWLFFSGADTETINWFKTALRFGNPISLVSFYTAFRWGMRRVKSGSSWLVGGLPLALLETGLLLPTFIPVPSFITLIAVLTAFWMWRLKWSARTVHRRPHI